MIFLFSILFVLGFFGFLISIVLLIVKKIRKKSIKKTLVVMAICFAGFVFGYIGTPTESNETAGTVQNQKNDNIVSEKTDTTEKESEEISNKNNEDIPRESETSDDENIGNELSDLDKFACEITVDTKMADIKSLAKSHNLYVDSRRTGTGYEEYRIAADKNVANTNKKESGSVIVLTYNLLNDDILEEVDYLDSVKMIEGYMDSSGECTMLDYHKPEIPEPFSIKSLVEFVEYVPEISTEKNLLEELFCIVNEETTKKEIMDYVDEHNLSYNSRGAGNEEIIAYAYKVQDKYGLKGSYIDIDFSDDKVSHLSYHDYPVEYVHGVCASFYADTYSYRHLPVSVYGTGTYHTIAAFLDSRNHTLRYLYSLRITASDY